MAEIIKKIVLDLGGKSVDLTPTQARTLKVALDELFGRDIIREREIQPWPYPIQPVYPEFPWYWEPPVYPYITYTTCGTNYDSSSSTLTLVA